MTSLAIFKQSQYFIAKDLLFRWTKETSVVPRSSSSWWSEVVRAMVTWFSGMIWLGGWPHSLHSLWSHGNTQVKCRDASGCTFLEIVLLPVTGVTCQKLGQFRLANERETEFICWVTCWNLESLGRELTCQRNRGFQMFCLQLAGFRNNCAWVKKGIVLFLFYRGNGSGYTACVIHSSYATLKKADATHHLLIHPAKV